jgi:hypothetical protein
MHMWNYSIDVRLDGGVCACAYGYMHATHGQTETSAWAVGLRVDLHAYGRAAACMSLTAAHAYVRACYI